MLAGLHCKQFKGIIPPKMKTSIPLISVVWIKYYGSQLEVKYFYLYMHAYSMYCFLYKKQL